MRNTTTEFVCDKCGASKIATTLPQGWVFYQDKDYCQDHIISVRVDGVDTRVEPTNAL